MRSRLAKKVRKRPWRYPPGMVRQAWLMAGESVKWNVQLTDAQLETHRRQRARIKKIAEFMKLDAAAVRAAGERCRTMVSPFGTFYPGAR